MMKRLFKDFHSLLFGVIMLSGGLLSNCNTVANKDSLPHSQTYFIANRIKKLKNDVFVIYATRNDSIYKIVSYYDEKVSKTDVKLVKGSVFCVSIESIFGDFERKNKIMAPGNEAMSFRGVYIGKEPKNEIYDVWFSRDLNGPFLKIK